MLKIQKIREEDYWLYFITFFGIVFAALSLYASVFIYRGPVVVLAILSLWFVFTKVKDGYSLKLARVHLIVSLFLALLLAWSIQSLTN